ncbi:MAG TPA: hypothetical protein VHV49_14320 [Pseudonocardiaceae bacterium]|jgi:lysylphosphatidylglycerol synthetase-like protein (DUF2156 family)|nr:hypothetical protein [Pseudonocardiaceae bacterium]
MASMRESRAWSGWVLFAALLMMIVGAINVIEGVVALIYRQRTVVVQDRLVVVNMTGWALTLIVFGGVLFAVGIGLLSANMLARWAAIILVSLHAIVQIGWLGAYPVWSLLMLALDVVVLYALAARWSDMRRGSDDYVPPARGSQEARQTWDRAGTR